MSCLNNYNLDVILKQLNCWCENWRGQIQTIFPSGMTMIEKVHALFTAVKKCCETQLEVMEEFCELYKFVNDFFENLDLQEEVNKWLDEALKNGTLENLLASIGLYRIFATTTDLINSESDFPVGLLIKTTGYYEELDGGSGVFYISQNADEEKISFQLKKGKYAIYAENEINIDAIGAKKNDSSFDNSFIITEALNKRLSYNNTIKFNSGEYYTTGVKFPSLSCLKIKGSGTFYYPDFTVRGTIIKGKESGAGNNGCIFDLTSSTGDQKGDISLEDVIIDGNNIYNDGLRLTFANVLKHVYAINCLSAGFRLVSPVYPVYLTECGGFYNKYGIIVDGPSSTVYSLDKCEFSRNIEGIYVRGGAGFTFVNCLAQSNRGVGLHISRSGGYLSNGVFINLYLENNGTLEDTDPNYSGNFSVIIEGTSTLAVSPIIFFGGYINRPSTAKNFKISNCYYCELRGMSVNWNNLDEIDSNSNFIKSDFGNNYGSNPNNNKILSSYQRKNETTLILKNYGETSPFSNAKTFTLKIDGINAGQSKQMTYDNVLNAIPIRGRFVVLSMIVGKIYNAQTSPSPEQEAGRLDFWVTYGRQFLPSLKITEESNAYLDNTEVGGSRRFNYYRDDLIFVPSEATQSDWSIGILCTASSDYKTSESEQSTHVYATITVAEF